LLSICGDLENGGGDVAKTQQRLKDNVKDVK
jgi:hypothetical protein